MSAIADTKAKKKESPAAKVSMLQAHYHLTVECQIGKWSPEEETCLHLIIQDMGERGHRPEMTLKFWKEVSTMMDHTRTGKQCSNKW
jgi:hypothetical protein